MRVVGVITARGGSKRVPGKNIRMCAGKPLLGWTCEAALGARLLDRVILSTDDKAIAEVGSNFGVEVPFLRPSNLAADDTPTVDVLIHLLNWLGDQESIGAIVLLQPTSPLRTASDIDGAIELFLTSKADGVVSTTRVSNSFGAGKLMECDDVGEVKHATLDLPPQDRLVLRNGPAVLVVRPTTLRSGKLYGLRTLSYQMPQERSVDIDTPFDFLIAELLLEYRQKSGKEMEC